MRRFALVAVATVTILLASGAAIAPATDTPRTFTVAFVSGPGWATFSEDPGRHPERRGQTFLGRSQNVCLNESSPANCPPDATLYGFSGSGWFADLAAVPGATWIWAPGITGNTSDANLAEYFFSRGFRLGRPVAGTVYVAADDFIDLRVNGRVVGTWGSISDIGQAGQAQNSLMGFDVTSALKPGRNVITLHGQNGPGEFAGCDPCTYSQNTSGVVFGGFLTFQRR